MTATPVLSEGSGQSAIQFTVSVTDATSGSTIYYTTDNTTPTVSSSSLSSGGTILIAKSETLQAMAVKAGYTNSAIDSATYQVTGTLSAGDEHTLALKSDGTVWAWGSNASGQLGVSTSTSMSYAPIQVGITGVIAIAAGGHHSLAVKSNGTVYAWGDNGSGQLGNNSTTSSSTPVLVSGLTNIIAVAAGEFTSLALGSNGTVYAWGAGTYGQLGNGTTTATQKVPVSITVGTGSATVTGIASGSYHSLALRSDGTVWGWGDNGSGQVGNNSTTNSSTPVQVSGLSNIIAVAAGNYHSLAINNSGAVSAWGNNANGSLGDGTEVNRLTPVTVSGLSGIVGISGGDNSSLAYASDGTIWSWGNNLNGQVGDGTVLERDRPVHLSGLSGIVAVASGTNQSAALKNDGTIWMWGWDNEDEIGSPAVETRGVLTEISALSGISAVSAGENHSLALKNDGTVWGWGSNKLGDVGDGSNSHRSVPVAVSLTGACKAISCGCYHSLGLKTDGTVWSWGYNNYGQLGIGNTNDQATPVPVSNLSGMTAISAGGYHTLALKSDGTVWAWGNNGSGELGNNSTTSRSTPVQVSGLSGITAISAGEYHSLVLKPGGSVWSFGYNNLSQLGNGNTTSQTTPVQVSGLTSGVTAIAAGGYFSLVLKSDGTVWAWGDNSSGQLGNNSTTGSSVPVQVSGLSNIIAIGAGEYDAIALRSDGTIWSWGNNSYQQIGNGTFTNQLVPIQPTGFNGITALAAGYGHNLALKQDGTVAAWGDNSRGELGIGRVGQYSVLPMGFGGLNLITAVPTVAVTSPSSGGTVLLGNSTNVTVSTSDSARAVSRVDYYNEGNLIGSSTTSPFTFNWTPNTWGAFELSGIATDSLGLTSSVVTNVTATVLYKGSATATPLFSPAGGTYPSSQTVVVTSATGGATIYYTINGTTPTTTSPVMASGGVLNVTATETIEALSSAPGYSTSAVGTAAFVIQPPPAITSATTATGNAGSAFSYLITASNSPTSFGATGLPAGLSLNVSTGLISGTPTTAATSTVTLNASNAGGIGTATLSLTVNPPPAPVITSSTTAVATAGTAFTYAISASNTPTSFNASGLPVGLSVNTSTGVISGVPASNGGSTIAIQATNAGGTGTATLSLTVYSPPTAPTDGTASITSSGNLNLAWINNGTSNTSILVQQQSDENQWTTIATLTNPSLSSYTIMDLDPDQSYNFRVVAVNSLGTAAESIAYTSASTEPVPSASVLSKNSAIAEGCSTTWVLRSDGTVWGTGYNFDGELGNGSSADSCQYVQVQGLRGVTSISGGDFTAIALKGDGTVWAWGYNDVGELGNGSNTSSHVPVQVSGLSNIIAIAAGNDHNLALKSDGTVWAWGNNADAELGIGNTQITSSNVPVLVSSLTGVVAIAAGASSSLAIKSDGTLWAWGSGDHGELGNGGTTASSLPVEVTALTGVKGISAGVNLNMALKADGTVWVWGMGKFSEQDSDTSSDNLNPVQVPNLTKIEAIKCRGDHALALKSDGTLWAWGYDNYGQLGNPSLAYSNLPSQVPGITGAVAIDSCLSNNIILKQDGSVVGFGYNADDSDYGMGGIATKANQMALVSGLSNITSISSYKGHSLALKNDGTVLQWGDYTPGAPGGASGLVAPNNIPMAVPNLTGVSAICCGRYFNMVLKGDGSVWAWGGNQEWELGNSPGVDSQTPVQVLGLPVITKIAATAYAGMAVDVNGNLWTWGGNWYGELGNGSRTWQAAPVQISGISEITSLGAGSTHVTAVATGSDGNPGAVFAWGTDTSGELGGGSPGIVYLTPTQIVGLSGITSVAASYNDTYALKNDGTVYAWGLNADGELGNGSTTDSAVPLLVPGLTGVSSLTSGNNSYHAAVVKANGTVWTWGSNNSGELGVGVFGCLNNGSPIGSVVPVQVSGITNAVAVSCGKYSTVVLESTGSVLQCGDTSYEPISFASPVQSQFPFISGAVIAPVSGGGSHALAEVDGQVWAWGNNAQGQVGNGTITNQSSPVSIGGLSNVIAVAAGGSHSLALEGDGTVWTWGSNSSGQLGVENPSQSNVPIELWSSSVNGITAIAAGYATSLALRSDGTVWSWGYNQDGELGNASTSPSAGPVQVDGLSGIKAIAIRGYHCLALEDNGTIWSWGANGAGQLGAGDTTSRSTPVQLSGIANASAIAAGKYFSAALAADGSLWTWGDNSYGQLGDGFTSNRSAPYQVGLSGVAVNDGMGLATGDSHLLVLRASGTLLGMGANSSSQLGDGTVIDKSNLETIPNLDGILFVSCESNSTIADCSNGLIAWGYNTNGELGNGSTGSASTAQPTSAFPIAHLSILSGNNQHSVSSVFLGAPLVVQVTNSQGVPLPGVQVAVSVATGGGGVATTNNGFSTASGLSVLSDSSGRVTVYWQQGTVEAAGSVVFSTPNSSVTMAATIDVDSDSNGLGDLWEIQNFGDINNNPNALAPNGNLLTLLQCYQQGISPTTSGTGPLPSAGFVSSFNADTAVEDSNGYVSQWTDPLQNIALNDTNGSEPTLGIDGLSGLPMICFNGTQYLTTGASLPITNDVTIISVASQNSPLASDPVSNQIVVGDAVNSTSARAFGIAPGGQYFSNGTNLYQGNPVISDGSLKINAVTYSESGQQASFYYQGVADGTVTQLPSSDVSPGLTIGSILYYGVFHPMNGNIAQLFIYNRVLTSSELQQVSLYLADKYEIYAPGASWIEQYSTDVQAEINANEWNKAQADEYVQSENSLPIAGLKLWLSADSGVSTTGGNIVSSWADKTGNYLLSRGGASSSNQPTLVNNDVNGEPAIRFNGTSLLTTPASSSPVTAGDLTILAVAMTSDPSRSESSVILGGSSNGSERALGYAGYSATLNSPSGPTYNLFFNIGGSGLAGGLAPSPQTFEVEAIAVNSNTVTFYRNGLATTTSTLSGMTSTGGGVSIGSSWDGDISEVLVYDHKLSASEMNQASLYLANKYNTYYNSGSGVIASWISGYNAEQQAEINSAQLDKDQADRYVQVEGILPVSPGLLAWFRADLGVETDEQGLNVLTWEDSSWNHNDVLCPQGNLNANQNRAVDPTLAIEPSSGAPTVHFNGNAYLSNYNSLFNSGDITIITQASTSPAEEAQVTLGATGSTGQRGIYYHIQTNFTYESFTNGETPFGFNIFVGPRVLRNSQDGTFTDPVSTELTYSSTTGVTNIYQNGISNQLSQTVRSGPLTEGIAIGSLTDYMAYFGWTGNISEVLIYNRVLSSLEISDVQAYLNAKYRSYTAAAPLISSDARNGDITASDPISLSDTTSGVTIRYTTDGSNPTANSLAYNIPFTLSQDGATVNCAVFNGTAQISPITSAQFWIGDINHSGIPDTWQNFYYQGSISASAQTVGGSGLTNLQAYQWGYNPTMYSTNGDGLSDLVNHELGYSATDTDIDGDGLSNAQELLIGTDPFNPDTDGDGYADGVDYYPLDPTRWLPPSGSGETTPPVITLTSPQGATLEP